jgi:hypothetical protein
VGMKKILIDIKWQWRSVALQSFLNDEKLHCFKLHSIYISGNFLPV